MAVVIFGFVLDAAENLVCFGF